MDLLDPWVGKVVLMAVVDLSVVVYFSVVLDFSNLGVTVCFVVVAALMGCLLCSSRA